MFWWPFLYYQYPPRNFLIYSGHPLNQQNSSHSPCFPLKMLSWQRWWLLPRQNIWQTRTHYNRWRKMGTCDWSYLRWEEIGTWKTIPCLVEGIWSWRWWIPASERPDRQFRFRQMGKQTGLFFRRRKIVSRLAYFSIKTTKYGQWYINLSTKKTVSLSLTFTIANTHPHSTRSCLRLIPNDY